MSDILHQILERKRWELDVLRDALRGNLRVPPDDPWFPGRDVLDRAAAALKTGGAEPTGRDFRGALRHDDRLAVIAELKRRSPSAGVIATWAEPSKLAAAYAEGGADAVSCLTDHAFFGGRPGFLPRAREVFPGPVLRKDFVTDVVDLAVSAALGADAVLLIVAALGPAETARLVREARAFGLEPLVEVHDTRELDAAMVAGAAVVGVNNRDLRTFRVDLGTTERLAAQLPDAALLVGESGIRSADDAQRMRRAGCDAVLVGESLARAGGDGLAALQVEGPRAR